MRQIVLDTETTGLSVDDGHRIVEVGCTEIIDRRRSDNNFHVYINPQRDMPSEAQQIHGLSAEFLADKSVFAAVADDFLEFIKDCELIIHNAPFDIKFLNYELKLCGKKSLTSYAAGVIDTLQLAKEMFPGKRNSLDMLCERFGVNNSSRTLHGALLDAQLLAEVYINMTRGQESLLPNATTQPDAAIKQLDIPSATDLPVIKASAEEIAAHRQMLELIDKKSNNQTIWRHLTTDK